MLLSFRVPIELQFNRDGFKILSVLEYHTVGQHQADIDPAFP